MASLFRPLQTVTLGFISLYRLLISPLLGPCCRFHPSCSVYATEALHRFGFLKGVKLILKRVICCNPWHPGGLDPVPNEDERR